jgi:Sec7 domain/PH domain
MSGHSGTSTPSVSLAPPRLGARGRSSTLGSLGISAEALTESSTVPPSGRTSTSTVGRKSFGDIFSLSHRLRQNSEPPRRNGSGNSPGTPGSKSNSLQIPRDSEPELVYPQRQDNDTPASYLEKLEVAVPRGSLATILCKSPDEFSKTCLRKYMRGFSYFGDSIDMAIRKMLMEVELPKETQQIDRLLAGFADRYHECNPGIFTSVDEASIAAFSILLLHSDTHNKNNKRKMQKQDYVKNTQGPVLVSADILHCFYDNVCYTPFIHFEDEIAVHSHRLAAPKPRKSLIKTRSSENLRGPVDPYALILDNKLSVLRPSLKDVMDTEDTYKLTGTASAFDVKDLHNAFLKSSVLQIVSARSRPDAFMTQATITNPAEAQAGLVSIKVAKVGLLWRKDPKKKKAKRPWQEWGAILTDSKLYFFRDIGWIKKLIAQYEAHQRQSKKIGPLVFTPPLTSFEPDALMSVDDTVALMDSSYKKHKNAFVFIKHGGFEEIFLANSEPDMNDWLGKLNYAATFRTAGVRMRGLVGTPHESDRHQLIRKDSQMSTISNESQSADPFAPSCKIDPQIAWEIMFYRRQIINERISDFDEKLAVAQKELDHLLRDARHLQILLPIQGKTREAIILAAGRMSAKLKWTRIEILRAKCHRDMLRSDLEQEGITDFPVPKSKASSATVTPHKAAPLKTSQQSLSRTNAETGNAVSPSSSMPSGPGPTIPHVSVDRVTTPEASRSPSPVTPISTIYRKSAGGLDVSSIANKSPHEQLATRNESSPDFHSLIRQASIISSHRSKTDSERYVKPTDNAEERVLREAGLIGVDGPVPGPRRPDTSGSEKDRVSSISPEITSRDRGSSVRRSLQRTLRDSHHNHHLPHHHRSKKGRDSGSSITATDDGTRSMGSESLELRRGTGSFIVHGKKASVVTFGSEWQSMTNEERMKLRKMAHEEGKVEGAVEDGVASTVLGSSTAVAMSEVEEPTMTDAATVGDEAVPEEHANDLDDQSVEEDILDSEMLDDSHPPGHNELSTSA